MVMFRPIRRDTPRGEAAYRYEFGIELMFVYPPLFLIMYYGEHAIQWMNGGHVAYSDFIDYPLWLFAIALFMAGIASAYDGWWHLRKLS